MRRRWGTVSASSRIWRLIALRRALREYSHTAKPERVTVPCRSNGSIALDIHRPTGAQASQDIAPKTLIYIPRGPLWPDEEQEAATISHMSQQLADHHIVRVHYRLDSQSHYPTPAHDVLAGFDWIVSNILPKRAISRPGRADYVGRIAVFGELVGGGLASMLALTECRAGESGIAAAAVNNPILDWVSLEQSQTQKTGQTDEFDALMELRRRLFAKPAGYFDPFASPLLVFRTPGVDVPPSSPEATLDDMAELTLHERDEYARKNSLSDIASSQSDEAALVPAKASRRVSRRFPSAALNLRLPDFHIASGPSSPFLGQAEEFAHVLRQSLVRQARASSHQGSSFGRKVMYEGEEDRFEDEEEKRVRARQQREAEEKAQLHRHRDLGLWDDTDVGRERLARVARWLKERTER